MEKETLHAILSGLIQTWENEVVEFKDANNNFSTDKIGKYFSALSNEANLNSKQNSWLIFGVCNSSREIVGTNYRVDSEHLHSLKMQMTDDTQPQATFSEIYETYFEGKRVVMFQVPAAPAGMPIAWKGFYYARSGESLVSLGIEKLDVIRNQTISEDWSAQIVENATITDLDEGALQKAKDSFMLKHASRFQKEEVANWNNIDFLDRAGLTQNGKITRAALLLIGKPESAYLLSPHPAEITWKLEGQESAYEHFSIPFLLNTSVIYQKIRNIQIRILPDNELVPTEVEKYDQQVVLEAMHNCIAHQDYTQNNRVLVKELPDKLIFENAGSFYEGRPDDYSIRGKTPLGYRNTFLVQAMTKLNMIDTMGYGIHRMHQGQARRYLPLPDYDLLNADRVRVTLYGGIVDPAYSKLLIQKTDLPLEDILALDRLQKRLPIPDNAIRHLRRSRLVEGRKNNLHISAYIAKATSKKADYIHMRAQDDAHYEQLIISYIGEFGEASREDIDSILLSKLSSNLDDSQKKKKISNLLSGLRISGRIHNTGSKRYPNWKISE